VPPDWLTFGSLPLKRRTASTIRSLFDAKIRFLPTVQA